jgi:hypothetical protein
MEAAWTWLSRSNLFESKKFLSMFPLIKPIFLRFET